MRVARDVAFASLTTLGVGGPAKRLVQIETEAELVEVLATDEPVLVIGGGSNLVVGDAGFPGTVVQLAGSDVTVQMMGDSALVTAHAGVDWDSFVAAMIDAKLAGVECMSGIPGRVGATPIQNVGAYGQEVSDTIAFVKVYDREARETQLFAPDACRFAYRTSIFRNHARWIVLAVGFRLAKSPLSAPIKYAELGKAIGAERAPLDDVRRCVIELRRGKGMVLDAGDPESRSAGSFFTNPIVDRARVPDGAPAWPQPDGRVKTSAAWLIEHAGFAKGYTVGNVGISKKHALALVNRGGATARELLALAREIQTGVLARFAIELQPEPVIVET